MKVLTEISQIGEERWMQLMQQSPYASPFQSPQMYAVYKASKGIDADVVAVEEEGKLRALVLLAIFEEPGIKAYFSRRGIVYGGPLMREAYDEAVLSLLLTTLTSRNKKRLIYLEMRNGFDYRGLSSVFAQANWRYVPWLNYQFKFLTPETFKQGMAKTRQRQLNKALSEGTTWRLAENADDVQAFYHILSHLYQHKIKKPLPVYDYFLNLYQSSITKLILVEKAGVIIGGAMCPYREDAYLYEYYICGLDRDYPASSPSTMAMWAMVCLAKELGVKHLDLMGAGEPDKPNGVRDYKRKFGGDLVEHGRYLMVLKPSLYQLGRWVMGKMNRKG